MKYFPSLLLAATFLVVAPLGAEAQDLGQPCGQIFSGVPNGISSGEASRITADIEALQGVLGSGLDVHVHLAQNLRLNGRTYPNIDAYSDALDSQCGWAVGGGVSNGMLVYIVVVDTQEWDIYNGRMMEPYLTVRRGRGVYKDHLLDNVMMSQLSDGNFGAAMRNAVRETLTHVRANTSTGSTNASSGATSGNSNTRSTPPPSQPSEPFNTTPLFILLILIVLAVGGGFWWQGHSRKKRRRQQNEQVREDCKNRRGKVSEYLTPLSDADEALGKSRINTAEQTLGTAAAKKLRNQHEKLWEEVASYRIANAGFGTDIRDGSLDADPYTWEQLRTSLDAALGNVHALKSEIDGWKRRINDEIADAEVAYARPTTLGDKIEAASSRIQVVGEQGFIVTSAEAEIERALGKLEAAFAAASNKELSKTKQLCAEIENIVAAAATAAEDLIRTRDELNARHTRLGGNHEALEPLFGEAQAAHALLEELHVESSWSSVAGNGTEADDRYDWAADQLEEFASLMEKQNFSEAKELLDGVDDALDAAEGLLRAIIEQKDRAEQAKQELGNLFDEAGRDIEEARRFINQNDDDINEDPLQAQLSATEGSLTEIQSQSKGRVDYIALSNRVRRLMQQTDEIFGDAKRQDDAAEALRRRHARERAEAESAIASAKRYTRNHAGDVGSKFSGEISAAESYLREGDAYGTSLTKAIRAYQQAEDQAEDALRDARAAVRRAEQRRADERAAEAARLAAIAAAAQREAERAAAARRRARQRSYSSTTSWGSSSYKSSSSRSGFGGGGFKSSSSRKGW